MKKKAILNFGCSIVSQIISVISGLVVPRLILETFGSDVNGLLSSLTQFLNYISLVEGGLGSVVIAAAYLPLVTNDSKMLSGVVSASNRFFKQIAYVFVAYAIVLGVIYPYFTHSDFSFKYIFILTLILSAGLFIQYFFSITYKLLLQADQKLYIVQTVQICTTLVNLTLTWILIKIYPNIHIIKLVAAMAFLIQPVLYYKYVEKHYNIDKNIKPDERALTQRWDCFGQNFAYFIHNNTDVVVLTLFTNFKIVSVYSVYFLVVNNLKYFLLAVSNAFTPIIGKLMADNKKEEASFYFEKYVFVMSIVSTVVFGCCIYLLPPFVMLYTNGIHDTDYWRPIFSLFIVLAEYIYCFREPYISLIYATGRFKETAKSAYVEAAVNLVLSVCLVYKYGLTGIAIGTLIAMVYRMIYSIAYVNKHIIKSNNVFIFKRFSICLISLFCATMVMFIYDSPRCDSVLSWIKNAFICIVVYLGINTILNILFDNKITRQVVSLMFKRRDLSERNR